MHDFYVSKPIKPIIKTVSFNDNIEKEIFSVNITQKEFYICKNFSKFWLKERGEKAKGTFFGNEFKTLTSGKIGEMALGKMMGWDVSLQIVYGPDQGDFFYKKKNKKVDVKTSAFLPVENKGYVKKISHTGSPCILASDIYIFCYIENPLFMKEKHATVNFVGWLEKNYIVNRMKTAKGHQGKHINYEIPYKFMKPMSQF